jgi:hypothetical protein
MKSLSKNAARITIFQKMVRVLILQIKPIADPNLERNSLIKKVAT